MAIEKWKIIPALRESDIRRERSDVSMSLPAGMHWDWWPTTIAGIGGRIFRNETA
jgi:hypothetical protein